MSEVTDLVDVTIDDVHLSVPKGTLVIRAAEQAGIRIPRFCDHPLLKPVAACRQCLVEVGTPDRKTGEVRFMPKPQPSCSQTVSPGMVVKTQHTSEVARRAQHGVMEFLLINHPLDCPICDKGGECPLQNQAMSEGRGVSRFTDAKRSYPKPLRLTSQIMLDRDRCILCQRCVRFGKEIAGDAFIDLQGRGGGTSPTDDHYFMPEQIGTFDTQVLNFRDVKVDGPRPAEISGPYGEAGLLGSMDPGDLPESRRDQSGRVFASYFSGNIIQICPVGALTAASYRFRSRPFDLASTTSVTEQDASGSAIRVDVRRGEVVRHMAGNDPEVNEEWITDKDRFAFEWDKESRLSQPLVREGGTLVPTSWSDALDRVRQGLETASKAGIGLLPGGRLTFEDAWAWSKFARTVLHTDSIDARFREGSEEERLFLASRVAGSGLGVTYTDLERAGQVLLVGLEPEDECGAIFLRLRKGVLAGATSVATVAPFTTPGSAKLSATVLHAAPGTETEVVSSIGAAGANAELFATLRGGVVLVGERAARVPGLLAATSALADAAGARLQWVPRRSGERAALEAGLLPGLLPFGRPLEDADARATVGWGSELPGKQGLDVTGILEAAASGTLGALVLGGVDLRDVADPELARRAVESAGFVVSLEVRASEVTAAADVVLPVAPPLEKNGTFIDWEGRLRPFGQAVSSRSLTDRDVLVRLAREFGVDLGIETLTDLYAEVNPLMDWRGVRTAVPTTGAFPAVIPAAVAAGQAVLATHKPMLDAGLLQDGAPWLAGAAHRTVAFASSTTLTALGIEEGARITVSTDRGAITTPVESVDLPDNVVWVPECSQGSLVHESLGAAGSVVTVSATAEVAR